MHSPLEHHLATVPSTFLVESTLEGVELGFRVVGRGGRRHHPLVVPSWVLALGVALVVLAGLLGPMLGAPTGPLGLVGVALLLSPLQIRQMRVSSLSRWMVTGRTRLRLTPHELQWGRRRIPLHAITGVKVGPGSRPLPLMDTMSFLFDSRPPAAAPGAHRRGYLGVGAASG